MGLGAESSPMCGRPLKVLMGKYGWKERVPLAPTNPDLHLEPYSCLTTHKYVSMSESEDIYRVSQCSPISLMSVIPVK